MSTQVFVRKHRKHQHPTCSENSPCISRILKISRTITKGASPFKISSTVHTGFFRTVRIPCGVLVSHICRKTLSATISLFFFRKLHDLLHQGLICSQGFCHINPGNPVLWSFPEHFPSLSHKQPPVPCGPWPSGLTV